MSEHVLKKGECPVCDATEFTRLRADLAAARAEVERLRKDANDWRRIAELHVDTLRSHALLLDACKVRRDEALAALREIAEHGEVNGVAYPGDVLISRARRILAQDPGTTGGSGKGTP